MLNQADARGTILATPQRARSALAASAGDSIGMIGDTTADLQKLIDRLERGDDAARGELLARAQNHLQRIAASMFHRDFPELRDRHDLENVVNETWAGMMRALETARPPTAQEFLRLVAHKVRQVLLEMAGRQNRDDCRVGDNSDHGAGAELADSTFEPGRLALLSEFHRQVENLPDDERTVFDLHYYTDLPQAEVARILGMHPGKVSYLWVAATEKLAESLDGLDTLQI
jgi:RNA polymerase sigma factor (sigma-70 family)